MGNPRALRHRRIILYPDEYHSWRDLAEMEAHALGVEPKFVYISSVDLLP